MKDYIARLIVTNSGNADVEALLKEKMEALIHAKQLAMALEYEYDTLLQEAANAGLQCAKLRLAVAEGVQLALNPRPTIRGILPLEEIEK